jgi:hypothetical protein
VIREIYAAIRMKFTPGRVIVLLTSLLAVVLPPISAFCATWIAQHFPGLPPIDPNWLAGIFATSIIATVTPIVILGFKRLDGLVKYEALVADPYMNTEQTILPEGAKLKGLDGPGELSRPGEDIAESEVDDPDEVARREREELPDQE